MADAKNPIMSFDDDDDDIPVVDSSGTQRIIKGGFILEADGKVVGRAETPEVPVVEPVVETATNAVTAEAEKETNAVEVPVAPVAEKKEEKESELAKDIRAIEQDAAAAVVASPQLESVVAATAVVADKWEEMADAAAAAAELKLEDSLHRRFRSLAAMYFRDLRDDLETVSKMTMPIASGGLGLADAEAERVMLLLHNRNLAYKNAINDKSASAKQEFTSAMAEKQMREGSEREAAEKARLDALYNRVTEKINKPAALAKAMPTPAPQPVVTAPRIIPVIHEGSEAVPAVPAAPAAISVAEPLKMETSPAAAAVTVEAAAAKPAVMDVSSVPKLVGPVEELRTLRIVDFRRLSKDPREACLKIRDKVDLLAERSFAEKDRGVKAWQESEINRLYLELLRTSLDGKPVPDVIATRERNGEPTLSKLEFDAIMELNRKLRFG